MTQRRSVQDAIQWHEGMLLLPQHFQQMDRRIEHLISYHDQVTLPYAWGIVDFNYDVGAALSGKINILNLEAVMPDGSIVSSNLSQTNVLSLDLKPYIEDLQREVLTLYVVIAPYQSGKGNASADNQRFTSVESTSVVDENTGDRVVSIPTLSPNFMLKLSESEPLGYISLPLLKIQRVENVYQVSQYFAPQLKVTPDSPLGALCRTITQRIREKIIFLVDRLSSQTSEMVSNETENIIKALSAGLLPFEAIIAAGVSHPFQVYLQLTQLVAQLIGISPGVTPPLLNTYS
ncbi:MAG: type VI secretion system baseplate subunit TssK [Janthinobacterium lividum]